VRREGNLARVVALGPLLGAAAVVASCDQVHSDAVAALGGETAGVPQGPLHRGGQPCLLCHDGAAGDPRAFSVAGTVYQGGESLVPLVGGVVTVQSADGATATATTNAAGNFYLAPADYAPRYPLHVAVAQGGVSVAMHSHVGGDGSCAGCHADPAGPDSPGHVYFDNVGTVP
jgi:hypothetical protein